MWVQKLSKHSHTLGSLVTFGGHTVSVGRLGKKARGGVCTPNTGGGGGGGGGGGLGQARNRTVLGTSVHSGSETLQAHSIYLTAELGRGGGGGNCEGAGERDRHGEGKMSRQ